MYFIVATLIIAVACSLITVRVLVSYNDFGLLVKLLVGFIVTVSWFMPPILHFIRRNLPVSAETYSLISAVGYTLFGFAFILFMMLMLRDLLWFASGQLARLFQYQAAWLDPKNAFWLGWSNLAVVVLSLLLAGYAVFSAIRIPEVKTVEFASPKLNKEISLVHLSDLHINRSTSADRIRAIVDKVNALKPDVIVITGDLVDDNPAAIRDKMQILADLKSPEGVYVSIGNHELYAGLLNWLKEFKRLGFKVLLNNGELLKNKRVFIAGVADAGSFAFKPELSLNLSPSAPAGQGRPYRILLSHYPQYADYLDEVEVDLQLSGHTHGGQIFPFHFLAWRANKYLAGAYRVKNADLYVSRGTGYWGPPMRLFAPAEIALIKIKPQE